MTCRYIGFKWRPGSIDGDGHRTWKLACEVQTDDKNDGPAQAVQTPGLPILGDIYSAGNDLDLWAWCRKVNGITPTSDKGNLFFWIEYEFSTRPPDAGGPGSGGSGGKDNNGSRKKCADQRIEDPLSEPPSTSGSSARYTREEEFDQGGDTFRYTSFEPVVGSQREFDAHREQVTVEQNVVNLERSLVRSLLDKVNESTLWDMPARCWKLSDWTWERKLYGTCGFYYTRRLVFESNALQVPEASDLFVHPVLKDYVVTGPDGKHWLPLWDKYVLDQTSKVLNGHWHWISGSWILDNINGAAPNPNNPTHYITAKDRQQNPIRVILSRINKGQPATDPDGTIAGNVASADANWIVLRRFAPDDFFQLQIPATL